MRTISIGGPAADGRRAFTSISILMAEGISVMSGQTGVIVAVSLWRSGSVDPVSRRESTGIRRDRALGMIWARFSPGHEPDGRPTNFRTAVSNSASFVLARLQTTVRSRPKYPCATTSRMPRIFLHSTSGARDDLVRQVLGRFTDDLDVPHHGVAGALVGDEGLVGHALDEATDLDAAVDDVVGVEPPVPGARRHPPPRARPRGASGASTRPA